MAVSDLVRKGFERIYGISLEKLAENPDRIKELIFPSKQTYYPNITYHNANPQEADRRSREILKNW